MKVTYDKNADTMLIMWNDESEYGRNLKLMDSYEFMLVLDKDDKPIGIEILTASKSVLRPEGVEYEDITSPLPEKPSVTK